MVRLAVPLIALSEGETARLFREALAINDDLSLTGAARIGLSASGDMLVLTHAVSEDEIAPDYLWGTIEAALLLAREIRGHLRSDNSIADAAADTEDRPAEPPAAGPSVLA